MSAGLVSDEVAEDYKNSLEDLIINSKYEIANLTVIAKENTEHASAISRVLQNHIRTTPPARKLPAMYVLDSVIKNVGTPYTLYLGNEIYNTFMHAYTVVDANTRKKLDEMLRTWKEPVPGSVDTRPVFPPERTRPIENALIKARTAAHLSQQQQQARSQQASLNRNFAAQTPMHGWPATSTPPPTNGQFHPPSNQAMPHQGFLQQNYPQSNMQAGQFRTASPYSQYPQHPPPQPTPLSYQSSPFHHPQLQQPQLPSPTVPQQSSYLQYAPPQESLESLHGNVAALIRQAQDEFSVNIHDTSIQTRLKALLDLQAILNSQQLPPDQIQLIRNQVNALSASPKQPSQAPPPPQQLHFPPPSTPISYQMSSTPAQAASYQPPHLQYLTPGHQSGPSPQLPPQPTDLSTLLSSSNLADIIAKAQRASATPEISQASLAQPETNGYSPTATPSVAAGQGSDLMASLRAAGLVAQDAHTPVDGGPSTQPSPTGGRLGPLSDIQLTSSSLKIPRPQLLSMLYEARPNQCATCARRFLATNEGRVKKAAHLDWHFRTNQRLADSNKRGSSRSWYVDELEWIKSRDTPEDIATQAAPESHPSNGNGQQVAPTRAKYIPVPSDQVLAKLPCPICQETFDPVWSVETQDFVWMDAVKIGTRVYHATCHSEVKKEEDGRTPIVGGVEGRGTPDSVLGKRKKADEWEAPAEVRVKS